MNIRKSALTVVCLLLVLVVIGCSSQEVVPTITHTPPPSPTATTVPISAIVMGAAEQLNAGDLEGSLAYWDDDAIFYIFGLPPTGTEIYQGKEQIRTVLEENVASHFKEEIEINSVMGDVVRARTTTWHDFTREIGVAPLEAIEVYVVEDGKIQSLTWYISRESLAKLKPALAAAMPPEPESASSSETPVSEVEITIIGGTCVYDGPLTLQKGPLKVIVDVQDQDKDKYAVAFLTLDPDKDPADLMAATIGADPSWVDIVSLREINPGENMEYDLEMDEGPVYVVCFSKPPDLTIGSVGPFNIVE